MKISIETTVNAPVQTVWEYWTLPEHITQWNAASPDWHTPRASNDLRIGGTFSSYMEAKDKSSGFDFSGTYTDVVPEKKIAYTMEDGRTVEIVFESSPEGIKITETFDTEDTNSPEMQRNGWQSILNEFKRYTEKNAGTR